MNTSDAFTLILNSWKSWSCRIFACSRALSTSASGFGSPYFSSRCRSSDPAFTPIRMEQPWSRAALMTSRTRSALPMLPGLMRRHAAPLSAASMARR